MVIRFSLRGTALRVSPVLTGGRGASLLATMVACLRDVEKFGLFSDMCAVTDTTRF